MNIHEQIKQSVLNSFIYGETSGLESDYSARLLTNHPERGQKVYTTINRELEHCDEFSLSVAFITLSGLQLFKPVLRELEQRGIRGRILTTNYLAFTQPEALRQLLQFENIELRMYVCQGEDGFHTKGYFFSHPDEACLIVGSSNLTDHALCVNNEFNLLVHSTHEGSLVQEYRKEFEELFHSVNSVPYEKYQEIYTQQYRMAVRRKKEIEKAELSETDKQEVLVPNSMQVEFVRSLHQLIDDHHHRALLISATGTGKTYASAFAVRDFHPKRILFLVHREQILGSALKSFQRVITDKRSFGLLSGSHKDFEADYLFSTVQTLSLEHNLHRFSPNDFDWIIIDEVHRAAAPSYQRIFDYFRPKFWLGMSATPQRTDGQSIYDLFDHNIAAKITLQDALEEDLLCPFHYYGIDDLTIDDQTRLDPEKFHQLVSDERIRHILSEANYYGWSGERVKGLMFVSTVQEAQILSEKLNERGLRTLALSGADSQERREKAIERLVQEKDDEKALDYLITVDIFNEGVDIPEVNQVLLLRPTQSAIVFVQQLGRGLRKSPGKDFVTILDFIGLYASSFMIAQALSGSRLASKSDMIRFVFDGTIPGISTIHFSELAKSRIYKSIEQAELSSSEALYQGWKNLEYELGRTPRLIDFDLYQGIDPVRFFKNKSYQCYYLFLKKRCGEKLPSISAQELDYLQFASSMWGDGKRPHELWLLDALIHHPDCWKETFVKTLHDHGFSLSEKTWINLVNQFSLNWLLGSAQEKWKKKGISFLEDERTIASSFRKACRNPEFVHQLDELILFGVHRWKTEYNHFYKETWLNLNKDYTYLDTYRLLDFPQAKNSQIVGGYVLDRDQHCFPVYINYQKAEDIAASINYEDHFVNPQTLIAFSKSNRTLQSSEIQALMHLDEDPLFIPLFVKKNTGIEERTFIFLGEMHPSGQFHETRMKDNKKVVQIEYQLETPVRSDLYDYFTTM